MANLSYKVCLHGSLVLEAAGVSLHQLLRLLQEAPCGPLTLLSNTTFPFY